MIHSLIAMRYFFVWVSFLYLSWLSAVNTAAMQANFDVVIQSPVPGQAVQGVVEIRGNNDTFGFQSYQLAFSFDDDPTQTWFIIAEGDEPVQYDTLGQWDTTSLTDGAYTLRMSVEVENGEPVIVLVEGLRVRNYTPIETDTPGPTALPAAGETISPTSAATEAVPTPTDLAPNPAEFGQKQIRNALIIGLVLGAVIMAGLGLYSRLRRRNYE